MRFILLSLVLLAFVGCGTDGGSEPLPVTQSAPVAASAIQVAQSGEVQTYAPETFVIDNTLKVVLKQPALGWFPSWSIIGGTLNAGNTCFEKIVVPTDSPCIVTITWYQITIPPPVWN